MSAVALACRHWIGDQSRYCDSAARLYLIGARCPAHTPAALAGRPEPSSVPLNGQPSTSDRRKRPMPDPRPLLAAALDLAARGWHVFPLRPNDKRPAFPDHDAERCNRRDPRCRAAGGHVGWEARATTDPDRIRRAWTSGTAYNVGVACGPSGLVVVDLDKPKPGQETPPEEWHIDGVHDGFDVYAVVCERVEQPLPLDTFTVTTGRGGTHLYYRHPENGPQLRNTEGSTGRGLGWLVDTRAHGGYVVAPGSTVAGRPYTVAADSDPKPLPEWLAERLRPAPLPAPRPVRVELATDRRGAYLDAAIHRQIDHITGAAEGGRNRALYMSAVILGGFVASGELSESYVESVLSDAAHAVGLHRDPPTGQIEKTIRSGLRAGTRRPRSVAA